MDELPVGIILDWHHRAGGPDQPSENEIMETKERFGAPIYTEPTQIRGDDQTISDLYNSFTLDTDILVAYRRPNEDL
jgi:hypothetical protein